jgi:hypothetical protein
MKRPRVRISTLMFLVVIAALVVALVVERRSSAVSQRQGQMQIQRLKRDIELIKIEFGAQHQDLERMQAKALKPIGSP